jgi:hypothetical protein
MTEVQTWDAAQQEAPTQPIIDEVSQRKAETLSLAYQFYVAAAARLAVHGTKNDDLFQHCIWYADEWVKSAKKWWEKE